MIQMQATHLSLSWIGGLGPYQMQMATKLNNPAWQTIAGPLATNGISLAVSNDAAFYRVIGQ